MIFGKDRILPVLQVKRQVGGKIANGRGAAGKAFHDLRGKACLGIAQGCIAQEQGIICLLHSLQRFRMRHSSVGNQSIAQFFYVFLIHSANRPQLILRNANEMNL